VVSACTGAAQQRHAEVHRAAHPTTAHHRRIRMVPPGGSIRGRRDPPTYQAQARRCSITSGMGISQPRPRRTTRRSAAPPGARATPTTRSVRLRFSHRWTACQRAVSARIAALPRSPETTGRPTRDHRSGVYVGPIDETVRIVTSAGAAPVKSPPMPACPPCPGSMRYAVGTHADRGQYSNRSDRTRADRCDRSQARIRAFWVLNSSSVRMPLSRSSASCLSCWIMSG
jgi:hypothetical protein